MKAVEEKLSSTYVDLLVNRISEIGTSFETPWIRLNGLSPQNLAGRKYNAGNTFFLLLQSYFKGYSIPVFMTFNQCKEIGVKVNKGEQSFPVLFYSCYYIHFETKTTISEQQFEDLSEQKQEEYNKRFTINYYNVFNIFQTNFREVHPEKYQKYLDVATNGILTNNNDFNCDILDNVINNQSWYCLIDVRASNQAFYKPSFDNDFIVLPLKEQFENKQDFYSTLLHEMAHSTGHHTRLDRDMKPDEKSYAKEELIAELTAAMTGCLLNVSVSPGDQNAAYLKSWLKSLKEEPKFLFTLIAAVNKASDMILKKVNCHSVISETV